MRFFFDFFEKMRIRRSVSRVLFAQEEERDGHSSGTPIAGRLVRSTLTAHLGNAMRPPVKAALPSLFDLAPGGACRAVCIAADAVRSYRTFSPLLLAERFVFCGAFPGVAPAGRYPAPCFHGARTFLRQRNDRRRPSDRLIESDCVTTGGRCQVSPARARRRQRMARVCWSATPSMRQGRKCRCMARSTAARSGSGCSPCCWTS